MAGETREVNGHVIEHLRKAAMLTMTELAETAEVAISYVSELERGSKTAASPTVIRKLASVLGCTPETLLAEPRRRVQAVA